MKKTIPIIIVVAVAAAGAWMAARGSGERGRGWFEASGIIESDDAAVGSKEGGRVLEVMVKEGDRVKAGRALVRLDAESLEAAVEEAEAGARMAEARLAMLRNGYTEEEVDSARAAVEALESQEEALRRGSRKEQIDAARAEMKSAEAQYENIRMKYERLTKLYDGGVAAEQEIDDARAAMETAGRRAEAARAAYILAEKGPRDEEKQAARHRVEEGAARLRRARKGPRDEEISQAAAALDQARAHLRLLRSRLAETVITAPADAVVDSIDLQPGDMIAPGEPAARLIFDNALWLRVFVPENLIGHVRAGRKVELFVDSFPDKHYGGTVSRVANRAEFTPRNVQTPKGRASQVFRVRVTVSDDSGDLRAGMTAVARFPMVKTKE